MNKKEFNPNNIDEIYKEVLTRRNEWLTQKKSPNVESYMFIIELSSDNKNFTPVSESNLKNEMIKIVKGYVKILECRFPKSLKS